MQLLGTLALKDLVVRCLFDARDELAFDLFAWVVMPEHVHVLVMPPGPQIAAGAILKSIKAPAARVAIARWRELRAPVLDKITGADVTVRLWQRGGGHDRNVRDRDEFDSIIRYIHENPVRRGLVNRPEDWVWSSAAWYAGDRDHGLAPDRLPW